MTIHENGKLFYTDEQELFIKKVEQTKSIVTIGASFNMKVLLLTKPFNPQSSTDKESVAALKKLLVVGADIRYKEISTIERIILFKNELFVSYSSILSKPVSKGWYYRGNSDDLMIYNYRNIFESEFSKAKKLKLDKKGNIRYADIFFRKSKKFLKENIKELIFMIIGAVLGAVLGIIIK
jgi:hypothetical protein